MNYLHKKLLTIVLLLGIAWHFSLIIVYEAPFLKNKSGKLSALAFSYVYPYFHQSWELFVPAPKANHFLYVRYQQENTWSTWSDILNEEIIHQKQRIIKGDEMVVLSISTVFHYAKGALTQTNFTSQNTHLNTEVYILNYLVNNYLVNKYGLKQGTSYEFILYVQEVDNKYACKFNQLKIQ